jgi:hypothetical protein
MRAILITIVAAAALVGVGLALEYEAGSRRSEVGDRKIALASATVASVPPTSVAPASDALAPQELEERVFELPEDNLIWYTTIIYPENREADAASRKIAAWFATEPRLQSLVKQTRFVETTPANQLYAGHVNNQPGTLPFVWVQRGKNGQAIYKTSADALPESGKALADAIAAKIEKIHEQCPCRPHRPRPSPQPSPQPTPQPGPNVGPDVGPPPDAEPVPDMGPVDEPEETPAEGEGVQLPEWSYGLIPLVLVLAAIALERATRNG